MHQNSMNEMSKFLARFDRNEPLRILDVGSRRVDNQPFCYRDLMSDKWEYTGLDIEVGENVDIISTSHYKYPFDDESFDVIISGQTLEHISFIWFWIKELYRLLKKGGTICIIAPAIWSEHRYPRDCWRILSDGMERLLWYGEFKSIEVHTSGTEKELDCIGVGRK